MPNDPKKTQSKSEIQGIQAVRQRRRCVCGPKAPREWTHNLIWDISFKLLTTHFCTHSIIRRGAARASFNVYMRGDPPHTQWICWAEEDFSFSAEAQQVKLVDAEKESFQFFSPCSPFFRFDKSTLDSFNEWKIKSKVCAKLKNSISRERFSVKIESSFFVSEREWASSMSFGQMLRSRACWRAGKRDKIQFLSFSCFDFLSIFMACPCSSSSSRWVSY